MPPRLIAWHKPRVPVWFVRAAVIVVSSLIGAVGGSLVWVHNGGFDYEGSFWPDIGWTMALSMGIALAAAFVPWVRRHRSVRRVLALLPVVVVAWLTADGWLTLAIGVGSTLCLMAIFVGLQRALRRGTVLSQLFRRSMLTSTLSLALALSFSLQIFSAGSAAAQVDEADPAAGEACGAVVELLVDDRPVALDHAAGSNPEPHVAVLDLADGSTWDVVARSIDGRRAVVTVELVRTSPVDVVRGAKRLVWHTEVEGPQPESLSIDVGQDSEINAFVAEASGTDGTTASIEPFAGVGTFHVTVRQFEPSGEPGDRCIAEVNVRVAGSPWGTDLGRIAVTILVVGAAGCGSTALSRPRVSIPPVQFDGASLAGSGGAPIPQDSSGTYQLTANEPYELRLDLRFLQLEERREEIDRLRATDLVALSGIAGLVKLSPALTITPDGSVVAISPFRISRDGIDGQLIATVGEETLSFPLRTEPVSAPTLTNEVR